LEFPVFSAIIGNQRIFPATKLEMIRISFFLIIWNLIPESKGILFCPLYRSGKRGFVEVWGAGRDVPEAPAGISMADGIPPQEEEGLRRRFPPRTGLCNICSLVSLKKGKQAGTISV
jgi:hypothetical protein